MADRIAPLVQRNVPLLSPETPIRAAVARLIETGTAAAPVVDGAGTLIGLLTQKDCFRPALLAAYHQEWRGTVGAAMTADPRTLDADTDITTAAERFLDMPFRAFPVLKNGRLLGMLTRADLLRAFLVYG